MMAGNDQLAMMLTSYHQREKPVVLHVDDDAASLMMAEGALEDAGFDVVQASDGIEAIEQFHASDPDLIIMDAMMPNMDGFEAISHLRRTTLGAHVPILMITGLDDLDSITRAYDEGATDFLTKPINFFILPYRVQYMLRSKATADALRASQLKLDNAQRIARLGHWEWATANDALTWSREFARILHYPADQHGGSWQSFLDSIDEDCRQAVRHTAAQAVEESREFSIEFTLGTVAGDQTRTIRLEAEPHLDDEGCCTHMLGTLQDITERTNAQQQIHTLAYFDLVTGLPNRAQLNEQLNYVLKTAQRNGTQFAVMFLDLDHFKQVNDTLGHDAGDDLLQQVATRLTSVVRETDSVSRTGAMAEDEPGTRHTVARLGGDEFVVLLGHINRAEDAARVAERLATSISEPYSLGNVDVNVTTTVGISVFPDDGEDAETLMKHADVAMYHAKEQGRNGYQFYSHGIHQLALARFSMERDLKIAIEEGQFSLVYQPKLRADTLEFTGVEALVRWNHPEKGTISPAEFIPLAEETGQIIPLGSWVLETACRQAQAWVDKGLDNIYMAVNCSPMQFTRGNIVSDIDNALELSGLDPNLLEIELTENLFLENVDHGIKVLNRMKQLGICIAIDDFGTGYSSLSYLKRLPVDKLKVDRIFVDGIDTDAGNQAIVAALVTLSHNLDLTVVAEGVETDEQLALLRELDCDEAQGFLLSYPLPPDELEQWLIARGESSLKKVAGL